MLYIKKKQKKTKKQCRPFLLIRCIKPTGFLFPAKSFSLLEQCEAVPPSQTLQLSLPPFPTLPSPVTLASPTPATLQLSPLGGGKEPTRPPIPLPPPYPPIKEWVPKGEGGIGLGAQQGRGGQAPAPATFCAGGRVAGSQCTGGSQPFSYALLSLWVLGSGNREGLASAGGANAGRPPERLRGGFVLEGRLEGQI